MLVLARLTTRSKAHDVLVGRLAVINPAARKYLRRVAAGRGSHRIKLRMVITLAIYRNGVLIRKSHHTFVETVTVIVRRHR